MAVVTASPSEDEGSPFTAETAPVKGSPIVHGLPLGILVSHAHYPRFEGDAGNAQTWRYPIAYHVVEGARPRDLVVNTERIAGAVVAGALELQRLGARLITTSCGFLVLLQQKLASTCEVPVVSSSLLQVPLLARLVSPGRAIGILTISASHLSPAHLTAAGITDNIGIVVAGMDEPKTHFAQAILSDSPTLDRDTASREHVGAATQMVQQNPAISAIVLECTNMGPYKAIISEATGLPVYDIRTAVDWAVSGLQGHGLQVDRKRTY